MKLRNIITIVKTTVNSINLQEKMLGENNIKEKQKNLD